ncbi:hypothetical protein NEF87_000226 [Candidatus Lokiarchaeum ossiferum]|uniref:Uncharacterized protein n=1 Tax=Candidatus Lokiarchaeum ossiferum TaxID=2951803 RepID=A0ABY6HKK3_9ARCH|nr:hypothetical protein NEF87_000226 [Candidatus Lokiarchaeum sp. B-35]
MIGLYSEDVEKHINIIKKEKTSLIINLRNNSDEEKDDNYRRIIRLELEIADMEIIRGFYNKAISNIKNGLIFLDKLQNSHHFIEKICLRGLIEEKFSSENRELFFKFLIKDKDPIDEDLEQISDSLRNTFAYIIDEFVENKFKANLQNLNKSHFYLYQNTPFRYLDLIPKPIIKIGSYPLYSEHFNTFFSVYSENWDFFSIKDNLVHPSLEYNRLLIFANSFKRRIAEQNVKILTFYENLLKSFSNWKTDEIKEWEKKTQILNHFGRDAKI